MHPIAAAILELVEAAPKHSGAPKDQLMLQARQLEILCREQNVEYTEAMATAQRLGVWVLS